MIQEFPARVPFDSWVLSHISCSRLFLWTYLHAPLEHLISYNPVHMYESAAWLRKALCSNFCWSVISSGWMMHYLIIIGMSACHAMAYPRCQNHSLMSQAVYNWIFNYIPLGWAVFPSPLLFDVWGTWHFMELPPVFGSEIEVWSQCMHEVGTLGVAGPLHN